MKKLNVKINNIAELVKNRNQQLLDHHMDKIDSITVGDENPYKKISNVKDKIDTEFNKEIEEVHLPISKNTQIPTPNVILRSALFGIVKKGNRKYEKNVLKATFNGYTVKYSGEQLDQSDLDVWLECLQRCQSTPLGKVVKFTEFLQNKENEEVVQDKGQFAILSKLRTGEKVDCIKATLNTKKTTSPPLFNEASLLAALVRVADFVTDAKIKKLLKTKDKDKKDEHGGIGTPATRHSMIEKTKSP